MAKINVVPSVKKYVDTKNKVEFIKLNCHNELSLYHESLLKPYLCKRRKTELKFIVDESLTEEGYKILVETNGVSCFYKTLQGKHNAIVTLKQLLDKKDMLTTCVIEDEPNMKIRSIMIDISRNKVPSVKTLKYIIEQLSLVKINDLQLYVEGRSFYFESLKEYYDNPDDFLTGEDVIELTKYAKERMIELTPNLNCFGHMGYWLNQKELNHLAMKPEGFHMPWNKARNYAQTINPFDEEAKKLVYTIIDDMLKYYPDSIRCNIGGDEPFELLAPTPHPKAKEIYENHLKDVIKYVQAKNKQVYMWGDVVREYPKMLDSFKDAILLDWCYEAEGITEERLSFYDEYKVPFIVCPGTGGWSSFAGKMDNMFGNIYNYAKIGRKHGALGMILTDWNDGGSMSQLVTNILCYIYGACYEWNDEEVNFDVVNSYLDENVYHNKIAQKVIDLGNTYTVQDKSPWVFSKLFNTFYSWHYDGLNFDIGSYADCAALNTYLETLSVAECDRTDKYLKEWQEGLTYSNPNGFTKELDFIYKLMKHSLKLNYLSHNLRNFYAKKEDVESLLSDVKILIKEYPKIWNNRNKLSDFKYSNYRFKLLELKYENLIRIFNSIDEL